LSGALSATRFATGQRSTARHGKTRTSAIGRGPTAKTCWPTADRLVLLHDADRLVTELGDLLLERLGGLRMSHVVDDDAGVLPGQFEHDRLTNPAVAAGDDRKVSSSISRRVQFPEATTSA
jgi:hypothetical protein